MAGLNLDPTLEFDIGDEVGQHLEDRFTELRARGKSDEEATRIALAEADECEVLIAALAAVERLAPSAPVVGGSGNSLLDDLAQDIKYGLRVLRRAPGFTMLAVGVLAIGIGASTAIFSAVNGVLLRPLPYTDPSRLVSLRELNLKQSTTRSGASAAAFTAWMQRNHALTGVAAYRRWGFDLTGGGEPERLTGARISANTFSLVGVKPLYGRTLLPGDDSAGSARVAVISEAFWKRRFGSDAHLIDKPINLNGQPYTVVGIVPQGFAIPEADVWVPLVFAQYELDQRGDRSLSVIGRLRPGATVAAAQADLQAIALDLQRQFPNSNAGWGVAAASLDDEVTGAARTPLLLLFVATCAVLLIAYTNLANLLLVRTAVRRREMGVRVALGAKRSRIARQLVTECLLIVLGAGVLGLLIAGLCTRLLSHLDPRMLPRSTTIHVDLTVVAFALLLSAVSGAGLAVILALDAARLDLSRVIKAGSSVSTHGSASVILREIPVVGQVALALLLLVGGGLLVRSFQRAQSIHLGFSTDRVLSMSVSLPGSRYPSDGQRASFVEALTERLQALPGIRSAAMVSHLPMYGGPLNSDLKIEGASVGMGDAASVDLVNITPGYFNTMGIRLLKGRGFTEGDRPGQPAVVVVDEMVARRYWPPQGDAVGKRVRVGATLGADTAWREVIGVVAGIRSTSPEHEADATIYVPYAQNAWPTMSLVVATSGSPEQYTTAVVGQLHALDGNQPVYSVQPMGQVVGRALASRQLLTLLMTGFAAVAFLLAVISVYGMLAYTVTQRTRELGIRLALGAQRRRITWLCVRRGLTGIGLGFAIGTVASLIAARFMRTLLYGVVPWDPVTFIGAGLLLGIAGLLACYAPARRAANTDPLVALRQE